ncbi:hypothetical protein PT974_11259 [Cladobotryum mycophilum]|uniref:MICOS complex subunit MIC12 n=1 Tax=Cladobotryum mycophilum TaxID=491253 RepID=A0ABR0S628_9HYPO
MGFATGFTGGVTLTLSVAYLTILAHQRNREAQSQSIRAQAIAIRSLLDPLPRLALAQRDHSVEVAKDRWNAEVLNAVRWVQNTDWDEIREGMEQRIAYLWVQAFGEAAEGSEKIVKEAKPLVQRTKASAEQAGSQIASAARGAFSQAKEKAEQVELSAENAALDARLRSRKIIEEKSEQAQGVISSAIEKGRDQAKALVGKAKTAVGLAESQVEEMVGNKVETQNPVGKALEQRYGNNGKDTRTIQEVLKERYMPMDHRDNTQLRGL